MVSEEPRSVVELWMRFPRGDSGKVHRRCVCLLQMLLCYMKATFSSSGSQCRKQMGNVLDVLTAHSVPVVL